MPSSTVTTPKAVQVKKPAAPTPAPTVGTTFALTLDSFRITNTRSRHEDTDYVSFTMVLKDGAKAETPQTLKKKIGDVNNGTHKIGLAFPHVLVKPTQSLTFNYLILNSGHKSESQVYSVLENTGGKLATAGLTAAGAAAGTFIPIPGLGTLLGAGAGWLVGEVTSLLNADCDGPVAAEQDTFSYEQLIEKTSHGAFKHETQHPGTNSADGCGSNSMYYVTWEIARA